MDKENFNAKRWNEDPLKGAKIIKKDKLEVERKSDDLFLEKVKKELNKKHSTK